MAKYTLPVATENILGGVKIGQGIDVTQDGVISIKDYSQMKEDISLLEESVKQGKALVASAITDKKVPTEADATFQTMADNVRKIQGGISHSSIYAYKLVKEFTMIEEWLYMDILSVNFSSSEHTEDSAIEYHKDRMAMFESTLKPLLESFDNITFYKKGVLKVFKCKRIKI